MFVVSFFKYLHRGEKVQDVTMDVKKPWKGFDLVRIPEMKDTTKFYDFQAYAIYQALNKNRYILGFSTGLGKSITSIATYFYHRKVYPKTKLLIVTKTSAMFQFANEISHFFNHSLKVQVVHASAKELKSSKYIQIRKKMFTDWGTDSPEAPDVIVTNYPMIRIEKEFVLKAVVNLKQVGWQSFLVLDEATTFKNLSSKISKAVYSIQGYADKVLGLTATLTKGKIEEMYNLYKGMGLLLAKNKEEFEKRYCILWQHPQYFYIRVVKGYRNVEELRERIEPYTIILKKSDASDSLPHFQFQKRIIEHTEEQMELIREIYSGVLNLTDAPIDYTNTDAFGQLKDAKILQNLSETGYVKRALLSPEIAVEGRYTDCPCLKTEEILQMLEEEFSDEKIVIYTPSKKYLHILSKEIKGAKSLPDYYRHPLEISGDIPPDVRFESVQKFSAPGKHNVMLLDNAGSEAINLQAASVMIITSMPDTIGDLLQIVGRISRISSKHKNLLLIYLLHENSQDLLEYQIICQQYMLFQAIHGESEKGILDISELKPDALKHLSDEDFISRSVKYLILSSRKSLAENYV